MSSAFGHGIGPIQPADYMTPRRVTATWIVDSPLVWSPACGKNNCRAQPTLISWYRYVTGRGGRVTTRRQVWCTEHGEAWRAKHVKAVQP